MKLLFILPLTFLIFLTGFAQKKVSIKQFKTAKKQSYLGNYNDAISSYKTILKIDEGHYEANFELGTIYLNHYNFYDSAQYYLNQAIESVEKDTIYETYLELANAQQRLGAYIQAIENYNFFVTKGLKNNSFGEALQKDVEIKIEQCKRALEVQSKNEISPIVVENLGAKTNTRQSEYASVHLEKENILFYTTRYKDGLKEKKYRDNRYFENEYYLDLNAGNESGKLKGTQLNELRKKHNAFVSKSFSEDTVVLYRANKLWFSKYENDNFTKPELFSDKINFSNYQPHGVFTKDGKTFIFSARDKDGLGGLDLYQSIKGDNDEWSDAKLLEGNLNTPLDEDSPFLSKDGNSLYFASKGHKGFGAYDLYKSEKVNGKWTAPVNLGFPINSSADDIFLSINDEENRGYLSSNRKGGLGAMDLYRLDDFVKPTFDCKPFVNKIFNVKFDLSKSIDPNGAPLEYKWNFEGGNIKYGKKVDYTFKYPGVYDVKLDIIEKETGKVELNQESKEIRIENVDYVGFRIDTIGLVNDIKQFDASVTQLKGKKVSNYFWQVDSKVLDQDTVKLDYAFNTEGWHRVKLQIMTLDDSTKAFETFCQEDSIRIMSQENFDLALENAKNKLDSSNNGLLSNSDIDNMISAGLGFKLKPVYFNFDKSFLTKKAKFVLDSNIYKLAEHHNAYIIVKGHTDAMGSDLYNKKLSERRSSSVMKYLLMNGVAQDRIVEVQNFGESTPAAPNTTETGNDNPLGRQLNRRVEFQLIKK